MKFTKRQYQFNTGLPAKQRGALTMISAVLILILLTEMVIYAAQVGVFEQRKSGNEVRQKQAFHAAELGIQRAQQFLLSNALDMTSQSTATGWLSEDYLAAGGTGRWTPCLGRDESGDPHQNWHPCYGEALDGDNGGANLRDDSYFYSEDGTTPTAIPIPIADGEVLMDRTTEASEVYALLCMLDVEGGTSQPVQGCLGNGERTEFDRVYFVVTLLARGHSECDDNGDCRGEALVAERIGSYGPVPGSGGPGVPLTSKTSLHPTGTVEIVPNPNGGGIGVPVSVWIDGDGSGNSICYPGTPSIDPQSNSWATCEMHEWYGVDYVPEDLACPTAQCECSNSERLISHGNQGNVRYDIVIDPLFPCNLFEHVFQTDDVDLVKARFTVVDSCDQLGPDSRGPIWVSFDGDCRINSTTVGSHLDPVFLVASTDELQIGGGSTIYGVVMTTDAEGRDAVFDASGGGTVIGAVMVDGELEPNYGSNFEIVWNEDLVRTATKLGSMGKLYGGWTDFHEDWR